MNDSKNKKNILLKVVIVVIVLICGVYLFWNYKHNAGLASVNNDANGVGVEATALTAVNTSNPVGFNFTTKVSGRMCTLNVCNDSNQCVALSGAVTKTGSCSLNAKQSTPIAQNLLNIINPNTSK